MIKVDCQRKLSLSVVPPVLRIRLLRYIQEWDRAEKVDKLFTFSMKIDLADFLSTPSAENQKTLYKLIAVVNHVGPRLDVGHYIATAKSSDGSISCFDDRNVKKVQKFTLTDKEACMSYTKQRLWEMRTKVLGNLFLFI